MIKLLYTKNVLTYLYAEKLLGGGKEEIVTTKPGC